MKICPNCQTPNTDDSVFCENCGAPIGAAQSVDVNQPSPTPYIYDDVPKRTDGGKNNTAIIIAVIIAVAIIVAAVAAAVIIKGGKKSETAPESTVSVSDESTEPTTAQAVETTTQATTQTTTQTTTQPTTRRTTREYYEDEYLYPSDSQYISYSELDYMSKEEVRRVLNEMYARHGARFEHKDNIAYFNSQSWYTARCSMEEAEKHFNKYERANRDLIVQYEKDMGWR